MSTLLQKEIKINRIVTTNIEQAKALDDPARIRILQILYHKQFSAEQIVEELHKTGYNKATTTIRHHLYVLKRAGLVEIVKMEEVRGAVMKFYGTSIKLLGYDIPPNFDSDYSKTITEASITMQKMIKNIVQNNMLKLKKKNTEKRTGTEQNYDQYLLMEIVNRALTKVLENHDSNLLHKK
ncbi:MAG: ArsR family transcriptional regulator [Nitrosopumilales archaeon]|nr:MAG: ArsR family transcriptional regulator [Nitrosopumilales archaeon]